MIKEKDIYINLSDLLYNMLLKWRFIIVCTIISTILLSCISIFTLFSKQDTPEISTKAQAKMEGLEHYNSLYAFQSDYSTNAIIMNLNPYDIKTCSMSYSLYSANGSVSDFAPVISELSALLQGNSYYDSLGKHLEKDVQSLSFEEAIFVSQPANNQLHLLVYYPDTDALSSIASVLDQALQDSIPSLEEKYGSFYLTEPIISYGETVDETVVDLQQAHQDKIFATCNKITEIEDSLSAREKTQISQITQPSKDTKILSALSLPTLFIYLIGGVLFSVFVLFLRYILSPLLHDDSGIWQANNIHVIERLWISGEKRYNFIDRFLLSQGYKNRHLIDISSTALQATFEKILSICQKNNIDDLYLISTLSTDAYQEFLSKVTAELAKHGISVHFKTDVFHDKENLRLIFDKQHVILMEYSQNSRSKDVSYELSHLLYHDIHILGVLLFQNQ